MDRLQQNQRSLGKAVADPRLDQSRRTGLPHQWQRDHLRGGQPGEHAYIGRVGPADQRRTHHSRPAEQPGRPVSLLVHRPRGRIERSDAGIHPRRHVPGRRQFRRYRGGEWRRAHRSHDAGTCRRADHPRRGQCGERGNDLDAGRPDDSRRRPSSRIRRACGQRPEPPRAGCLCRKSELRGGRQPAAGRHRHQFRPHRRPARRRDDHRKIRAATRRHRQLHLDLAERPGRSPRGLRGHHQHEFRRHRLLQRPDFLHQILRHCRAGIGKRDPHSPRGDERGKSAGHATRPAFADQNRGPGGPLCRWLDDPGAERQRRRQRRQLDRLRDQEFFGLHRRAGLSRPGGDDRRFRIGGYFRPARGKHSHPAVARCGAGKLPFAAHGDGARGLYHRRFAQDGNLQRPLMDRDPAG